MFATAKPPPSHHRDNVRLLFSVRTYEGSIYFDGCTDKNKARARKGGDIYIYL